MSFDANVRVTIAKFSQVNALIPFRRDVSESYRDSFNHGKNNKFLCYKSNLVTVTRHVTRTREECQYLPEKLQEFDNVEFLAPEGSTERTTLTASSLNRLSLVLVVLCFFLSFLPFFPVFVSRVIFPFYSAAHNRSVIILVDVRRSPQAHQRRSLTARIRNDPTEIIPFPFKRNPRVLANFLFQCGDTTSKIRRRRCANATSLKCILILARRRFPARRR